MVPKHTVLTSDSEEIKDLKLDHVRIANIPLIKEHDPPVVWEGGRDGNVIRIDRLSKQTIHTVAYRRVVLK